MKIISSPAIRPTLQLLNQALGHFRPRSKRRSLRSQFLALEALEPRCLPTAYFISPFGNDTNPGTSELAPWQTIVKVDSLVYHPGDSISFLGGQTYSGALTFSSQDSGTSASPVTIGSYGGGLATISSGNSAGFLGTPGFQGVIIQDLSFVGGGAQTNLTNGIQLNGSGNPLALSDYVRINDVNVSGYGYTGIAIASSQQGQQGSFNDLQITNSISHDNRGDGIHISGAVITGATFYSNTNVLLDYDTVYNNTGFDGANAGNGILISDTNGVLVENCVSHDNGWQDYNPTGGPAGIFVYDSNNATVEFCESYHNGSASVDGNGFDCGGGMTNSVYQYNYSHDNQGSAFLMDQDLNPARAWNNNTDRFNLSVNDATTRNANAAGFANGVADPTQMENAYFYNNVIYTGVNPAFGTRHNPITNGYVLNNIFYAYNGNLTANFEVTNNINLVMQGNDFFSNMGTLNLQWGTTLYTDLNSFSAGTGKETANGQIVGTTANPSLTQAGADIAVDNPYGSLATALSAYQLSFGSPLVGKGVNVAQVANVSPGTQDFFGIQFRLGGPFDIGADAHLGIGNTLVSNAIVATGAGPGLEPQVNVYDAATMELKFSFLAYAPEFLGGVRVAVGHVQGKTAPDIITAPGPGGGPDIRLFDGQLGNQFDEFLAYDYHFDTGVYVAAGDFNGDGKADIVTSPDQGGGPDIRIFDGSTAASGTAPPMIGEFLAYSYYFLGGVRIAVGNVTGTGPDIITSPGPGGGPDIRVFQGDTGTMIQEFLAYDYHFDTGVFISAADINGDGKADIITTPDQGGGPDTRVFNGAVPGQMVQEFLAYNYNFLGGVRVAALNINGTTDIFTTPGSGGGPELESFQGLTSNLLDAFFVYSPALTTGVYVGAG
jgi:hypothetical protein